MQVHSIISSAFVESLTTSIVMCPMASVLCHVAEIPLRYVVVDIG